MDGGNSSGSAPDLQSILATLAQYAPQSTSVATQVEQYGGSPTPPIPEEELRHTTILPGTLPSDGPRQTAGDPRLRPQTRSAAASPRPMIDPATITTWQDGLRCVTKVAASNAQFAVSIKRMMKDQKANEMRWYNERQNLKQTQANRSASAARAQSILKSLNTSFYGEAPPVEKPEVNRDVELADFDRKIYSAQLSMEATMAAELKSLGVPFFGTEETLVVPDERDASKEKPLENQAKWSPVVTESQLMELRRKMIGHLEDLYRD